MALLTICGNACADELRDYLIVAIKHGHAYGPITGSVAQTITARTGSDRIPMARVDAVRNYQDTGCKRLRVAITQDGVRTRDGRVITLPIPPFEMNMCLDGQPPKETLDPVLVQKREEMLKRQVEMLSGGTRR